MADEGSYVLEIAVADPMEMEIGAIGMRRFDRPVYAYVGSAFGPGGFSRLERHRETAGGDREPHWHIDHLLVRDGVTVIGDLRFPDERIECELAAALSGDAVPGFGCSDCGCDSHLVGYASKQALERDVVAFSVG